MGRRPKPKNKRKLDTFCIRVGPEMYRKVRFMAVTRDLNASQIVREALREFVEHHIHEGQKVA